jgi:hypothetical protein
VSPTGNGEAPVDEIPRAQPARHGSCGNPVGAVVAISGSRNVRTAHRCSVAFVAVNAEQAEDWNEASGREFIEQRERHERMLGRLTARLLAARMDPGRGERSRHRMRLR